MSIKTPHQIAVEVAAEIAEYGPVRFMGAREYTVAEFWTEIAEHAILEYSALAQAQRPRRSPMERFGQEVYEIMDGSEWSSDTLQAIGDYATLVLGMPFTGPDEGESA